MTKILIVYRVAKANPKESASIQNANVGTTATIRGRMMRAAGAVKSTERRITIELCRAATEPTEAARCNRRRHE